MQSLIHNLIALFVGALLMVTPPALQVIAKYLPSSCPESSFGKMLSDTTDRLNSKPMQLKGR